MGLLTALRLRRSNQWERPTLLDELLASPLQTLILRIFRLILFLRGRPFRPPRDRPAVRVVCLSDTHDSVVPIPDGDLLIHAGDLTNAGTVDDIQRQVDWLAALPHRHKVLVCGNHDSWFDELSRKPEDKASRRKVDLKGIHYLERSSVTLDFHGGRRLNVWGAPDIPKCGGSDFAFQYPAHLPPWKGTIPTETDILVTHAPPRHHRDLGLGCPGLLEEVWRVKPKLHVFGHVHWGRGREAAYFDDCQRAYEKVMSQPKRGPLHEIFPGSGWADALRVLWYGAHSILWKWLMGGPGSNNASLMINAGCMYGNTGKMRKEGVEVVEL